MSSSSTQNEESLQEVLSALKDSDPAEYHEVRYVAQMIVGYFKRPAHQITIGSIEERLFFFALYLSFERQPQYLIEILLKDADRLVSAAKAIRRARLKQRLVT